MKNKEVQVKKCFDIFIIVANVIFKIHWINFSFLVSLV